MPEPLDPQLLEVAKDTWNFDQCVSRLIALLHTEGIPISAELLKMEIRDEFNFNKMRELAGEARPQKSPVSSWRAHKYVSFTRHDSIKSVSRNVIREYRKLNNESVTDKKAIREGTNRLMVALEKAVRLIPLARVRDR